MAEGEGMAKRRYLVEDSEGREVCNAEFINDLSIKGAGNEFQWPASADGPFKVFADVGEGFGLIGTADNTRFTDDNLSPDRRSKPKSLVPA